MKIIAFDNKGANMTLNRSSESIHDLVVQIEYVVVTKMESSN